MPDDQQDSNQDNSSDHQDATGQDQSADLQDDQSSDSGDQEPKFNKTQLQQLNSMVGFVFKNSLDKAIKEQIMPMIENASTAVRPSPNLSDSSFSSHPAVKKLNEDLQEMILSGDVIGALKRFNELEQRTTKSLSERRQNELNKALNSYSDKPYYKEISNLMKEIATTATADKDYPPEAAAEYAYASASKTFLEKKMSGELDESGSLNLEMGGRPTIKKKGKVKLTGNLKAAFERDKAKGLYKTEEEWIENLAPQVRAAHGLI